MPEKAHQEDSGNHTNDGLKESLGIEDTNLERQEE